MDSNVAESLSVLLYASLINWVATYILVSGVIFEDYRNWVKGIAKRIQRRAPRTGKQLAYLVSCALCMGTWVGFALAVVLPGPVHPRHPWWAPSWMIATVAIILNGLLYKAVGHLFLQVNGWFHSRIELMNSETKANRVISESESDPERAKEPATS